MPKRKRKPNKEDKKPKKQPKKQTQVFPQQYPPISRQIRKSLRSAFEEKGDVLIKNFTKKESEQCPEIDPEQNLLESLLWPISPSDFMKEIFRKKVYVAKNAPVSRFARVINEHLFQLDIESLVENTASENVHVWMKPKDDHESSGIESFPAPDTNSAMVCKNSGASLYFRSPQEMADIFVAKIINELGINFGGRFPTGENKGEIEVFVSSAGHFTSCHFDYMENFTLQLQGSKKWKFKPSNIKHPIRGCTPHYSNRTNVEQQFKVHRLHNQDFSYLPPENYQIRDDVVEVTLTPGTFMYFPAGFWHSVECTEDSVSINLSLVGTTWADLLADSMRQCLWKTEEGRSMICMNDAQDGQRQVEKALQVLRKSANSLQPQSILPHNLYIPRDLVVDLDNSSDAKTTVNQDSKFYLNPLCVLIPRQEVGSIPGVVEELPSYASDPLYSSVPVSIGENEEDFLLEQSDSNNSEEDNESSGDDESSDSDDSDDDETIKKSTRYEYANESNYQHSLQAINQTLEVHGYQHQINLPINNTNDIVNIINIIHSLLKQIQQSTAYREEIEYNHRRIKSDNESLSNNLKQTKRELENALRNVESFKIKLRQEERQHKLERDKLSRELHEMQVQCSKLISLQDQYKHEMHRKERMYNQIKERLASATTAKSKYRGQGTMEISSALQRKDNTRERWNTTGLRQNQDKLYQDVVGAFQDQEQELKRENQRLRDAFKSMHKEFEDLRQSVIKFQIRANRFNENESPPESPEASSHESLSLSQYEMPFDLVDNDIESKLKFQFSNLQQNLESLESDQPLPQVKNLMNSLKDTLSENQQTEAEQVFGTLTNQIRKYDKLVKEQEQLLQMSLKQHSHQPQKVPPSTPESETKARIAEEKRQLKQREEALENEKRKMLEEAMQLDQLRYQKEQNSNPESVEVTNLDKDYFSSSNPESLDRDSFIHELEKEYSVGSNLTEQQQSDPPNRQL
eukprot:gb/GECH01011251.1/.p1 GENE.gb/GECH01011251.1/~~gb/GECH01011251.1/.p1  ORF type:complete len:972 (+),score=284.83 gb/GECH01011251.1/:1-2916(+)